MPADSARQLHLALKQRIALPRHFTERCQQQPDAEADQQERLRTHSAVYQRF